MNTILDPLLAVLAIVVPIGMAYLILVLQSRNHTRVRQKDKRPNETQWAKRQGHTAEGRATDRVL